MSNNQPVNIEIILRQNIAQELRESRLELSNLDLGFKKNTSTIKDQIAQQRQLIREITGDIKQLTLAAKEATEPGKKAEILGDLKGARKALAEEQAAMIGMQRQQIESNGKEAESHGGIIAGLGKWALGLATVAAAMEVGKKIIESTESTSHAFEQGIVAAGAATHYFFQSIATGDWSNFFQGMDTAIKGAVEYVNAMEEVERLRNRNKVVNSDLDQEVADALNDTWDRSKENRPKRIAGLKTVIKKTAEINTNTAEEKKADFEAKREKAATDTGGKVSQDEIMKIVTWDKEIKKIDELGKEYNKIKEIVSGFESAGRAGQDFTPDMEKQFSKAKEQLKELGKEGETAGKMAEKIKIVTFDAMNNVADAYKAKGDADKAVRNGPKFQKRQLEAAENQIKTENAAAAKAAKEAKGLDNRIKATKDLMDETQDANSADFAALSKKLVMLEAEKKLRQSMVDMQMMIAKNQPIDSKGATSPISAIYAMAKAGGIDLEKLKLKDTDIEVNKLKKGNEERIKQAEKLGKLSIKEVKDSEKLSTQFFDAADAAAYLSEAIGNSNQGLSDMLSGVGKVAGQIGSLVKSGAFAKDGPGMKPGEAVSAIIGGASQLIGLVVGAAAERKRVMDEYYASIISQQQEYNLLLNDQLRLNSDINGTVFLKDYAGTLKDSTKAYNDAAAKYNETLKQFSTSEAITGKKNVVSGGNVLAGVGAGAAMGAGVGSIVPVIGTVIGAAAGAIIGGLAGLFAKKKKDVVAPLLETYKDLITPAGEFDEILAKTLITNNLVTEATKATLQKLIDWKEAATKAREQLSNVIKDLAGTMGDDLRNALVTAFKDGTDASIAFGDSVNKVWENIMSNMIFNKVFEGAFKQLEAGMNASYGIGTDGKPITGAVVDNTWIDDFKKFMDQKGVLTDQFNKEMANAKQAGADAGFNIFNSDTANAQSSGMKGDIQRMTEETGSALSGNISAIRINMARILESGTTSMGMLQKSLEYQLRTADNTGEMSKTLTEMKGQLMRFELDGIKVK